MKQTAASLFRVSKNYSETFVGQEIAAQINQAMLTD
jgi:hypothetical protein